jgi:hypothetical protein
MSMNIVLDEMVRTHDERNMNRPVDREARIHLLDERVPI